MCGYNLNIIKKGKFIFLLQDYFEIKWGPDLTWLEKKKRQNIVSEKAGFKVLDSCLIFSFC